VVEATQGVVEATVEAVTTEFSTAAAILGRWTGSGPPGGIAT
jgi:hypothetical protein